MVDVKKLAGGKLYDYGVTEFDADQVISEDLESEKSPLPYQCIPVYLNADDALPLVQYQAASIAIEADLYVPDDVDESQIVWLIFRGYMGALLDANTGMTEWKQYLKGHPDVVLPVNLQVGNHHLGMVDYQQYTVGQFNYYAALIQQQLRKRFFPDGVQILVPKGSDNESHYPVLASSIDPNQGVYLLKQGALKMQFAFSSGIYNGDRQTYYAQLSKLSKPSINRRVISQIPSTILDWSYGYLYQKRTDFSNVLDVYCYDGRLEGHFLHNEQARVMGRRLGRKKHAKQKK